jgi:predicted amidohydrolase
VLAEAGSEQALLWADIDLTDRDSFRREVSCFSDRRPEIYGRWEAERSNP